MTSNETSRKPIKRTPRCETCNGKFGLIRHRFAHKQFCSKRCLDRYLVKEEAAAIQHGAVDRFFPKLGLAFGLIVANTLPLASSRSAVV